MKSLDQIEARIILNAANAPGDATNTYIITTAGSYYLTGNVTGAAGKNGISVRANDVTLDLNGFALLSAGGAGLRGIDVPVAQTNLCVRNGNIRGWAGGGVRAEAATTLAEKLNLANNVGGIGLAVGNGSEVRDCLASANGTGFYLPDRTTISNCISTVNTGVGFSGTSYVNMVDCTSSRNGGSGFTVGGTSSLSRCSATRNDLMGIQAGIGCTIDTCTVGSNQLDGINVDSDGTIRNCTSTANVGNGITVLHGCLVTGNTCNLNATGIAVFGPDNGGERNRIDSNSCNRNGTGISIYGLSNLITRNSAGGNTTTAFSIFPPFFNRVGTSVSDNASMPSAPAWANFSY